MQFEKVFIEMIRGVVRDEIAAASMHVEIDLISIEQAMKVCGTGRQVIDDLIHDAETNGFPSVVLGARTTKIDRNRLGVWLASGGLKPAKAEDESANVTQFRRAG